MGAIKLKINPANLPYRGAPTKDVRPAHLTASADMKIKKVTTEDIRRQNEKWRQKHLIHVHRSRKDKWTPELDEKLMEMYWDGAEYEEMSKAVGRTLEATKKRANMIRRQQCLRPRPCNSKNNNMWQVEEDKLLIEMWQDGVPVKQIKEHLPKRTAGSIYARTIYLRDRMGVHLTQRKRRA